MVTCAQCGARPATARTVAGRELCDSCMATVAALAGAGGALAGGSSPAPAVGRGLAAGTFFPAVAGEATAREQRRRKLAATTGRWRRLWVRVVG
jgi:hypothetical protein